MAGVYESVHHAKVSKNGGLDACCVQELETIADDGFVVSVWREKVPIKSSLPKPTSMVRKEGTELVPSRSVYRTMQISPRFIAAGKIFQGSVGIVCLVDGRRILVIFIQGNESGLWGLP